MKKSWIITLSMLMAVAMFTFMGCGKPPTAEECEKEEDKVEKWADENAEEAGKIQEKYKDIEAIMGAVMEGKEFDEAKLKDTMTKMFSEGLKAAGANTKCAAVLAAKNVTDMKKAADEMKKMMEGLEDMGGEGGGE